MHEGDGARGDGVWRRWCMKAMVQGVMVYGGDGA